MVSATTNEVGKGGRGQGRDSPEKKYVRCQIFPSCNIVMTFYQDGQGKSLQDDIGIFEKVCFSRGIVGKYMCVDCIERQLSPKKNRLGGRGQKVPEFQSLIYHRSWVHSSARRCSMCRATEFSVHLFTCWLWLESQAVPSAQTNDGPT